MAEIDQVNEEIAFLTKLLMLLIVTLILIISGVVSLHLTGGKAAIYWFGVFAIVLFAMLCSYLFIVIRRHILHSRNVIMQIGWGGGL